MAPNQAKTSAGRSPFGDLLQKLRTAQGLTQEGLAAKTVDDPVSFRSITSYEKRARLARDWVLPHRPALRQLAKALDLDPVDRHALATAWSTTQAMRIADPARKQGTSFVTGGREKHVQAILEAWKRAEQGAPQMVFLGGSSGMGKTSIARYVGDRIASDSKKVMISWGAASGWATAVEPYLAVRTAMDRLLVEPDTAMTLPGRYGSRPSLSDRDIEHITKSIPMLGGVLISDATLLKLAESLDGDQATQMAEAISTLASTDTPGRHTAFSHLLSELSHSWPILMVLEDIHWASDTTIALLLHLAQYLRTSATTPIMILATYRSNEISSNNGAPDTPLARLLTSMGHSSSVTRIELDSALTPASGKAFVEGVVNRTPLKNAAERTELIEWLFQQTTGYPLLTMELVRHLLETGALKQDEGTDFWTFDRTLVSGDIPVAVSTFVDQRLRRLTRRARRILEISALMDDAVRSDVVADVVDMPEDEVLDIIDQELTGTHHFLFAARSRDSEDDSAGTFRIPHALIGEHIRSTITGRRRKLLHKQIAEVLEKRAQGSDLKTLGKITSHYSQAGDWHSAALSAYRLAQEEAGRLDWDLARIHFDEAEALAIKAGDPQQLWRCRAARLVIHRGLGEFEIGFELGDRIIKLAEQHNWPLTLALAHHHLGEINYDLGNIDNCVDHLQKAIALHGEHESWHLAAAGEAMLSHGIYRQGKYDLARSHALKALEYSRKLGNSWVQPEAILAAANCEVDLGFYEEAIENYEVSTELAVMIGKLANQYIPAMNIGLCRVQLGQPEQAVEDLTSLIKNLEHQNLLRLSGYAIFYLGLAYEALEQWDNARKQYERSTFLRRERSQVPLLFDSLAGEMRIALATANRKRVEEILEETTAHISTRGWEGMEDPLLVKLSVARAFRYLGDEENYRDYITRAHDLLESRAALIQDPTALASYLNNVPVNVTLRELYATITS